jgi:DNA-3-methyladenine glycosylase II
MPYLKQLRKDPVMQEIVKTVKISALEIKKPIYLQLIYTILGQNLNPEVAKILENRFHELFRKKIPTPKDILDVPFMELREIGLSTSKTNYILNICDFFIEQKVTDNQLQKMEDEALIEFLTSIKGVGRWNVEMVMIFAMQRENIFPVTDAGLQKNMAKYYRIRNKEDKKALMEKMTNIAEQWQPYRTYACLYLWMNK